MHVPNLTTKNGSVLKEKHTLLIDIYYLCEMKNHLLPHTGFIHEHGLELLLHVMSKLKYNRNVCS